MFSIYFSEDIKTTRLTNIRVYFHWIFWSKNKMNFLYLCKLDQKQVLLLILQFFLPKQYQWAYVSFEDLNQNFSLKIELLLVELKNPFCNKLPQKFVFLRRSKRGKFYTF